MTAQDHLNYAQDLFKRAKICEDKATRDRIMDVVKDNLSYYFELLNKAKKDKAE